MREQWRIRRAKEVMFPFSPSKTERLEILNTYGFIDHRCASIYGCIPFNITSYHATDTVLAFPLVSMKNATKIHPMRTNIYIHLKNGSGLDQNNYITLSLNGCIKIVLSFYPS